MVKGSNKKTSLSKLKETKKVLKMKITNTSFLKNNWELKIWGREDDYEYEIFSILRSAHAWAIFILAGKRGSRRHSTTGFSDMS